MSKYIKLEDAIEQVKTEFYGGGYQEWLEISIDNLINRIANLPTIEVSEDAISREWLIKRFKDIVEHYEMRIKKAKRYGKKTTYDTSEQIGYWKDEIADCKYFIKEIENAPSVIPKPKEGEWMPRHHQGVDKLICECSNCHTLHVITDYCPNCGSRMKGAEDD